MTAYDQRGERAHAGRLGQHLDRRLGPRPLVQFPVEPVDGLLQGIDQRQAVVDHLTGDGGQRQAVSPALGRRDPVCAQIRSAP
jgi:hypothetical protein